MTPVNFSATRDGRGSAMPVNEGFYSPSVPPAGLEARSSQRENTLQRNDREDTGSAHKNTLVNHIFYRTRHVVILEVSNE